MKQLFRSFDRAQDSGRAPSLWRYRDLRVAASARAVSALGDEVALVALLLRVHDEGHGPTAVTGLLVAAALPTVALAGVAGRVVDRYDSRRLAVVSGLWQAAACLAVAFAGPLWLVFALVAVLQAGNAVSGPTWQALVPDIVRREELGRALGAMQALTTLAAVAGPAVGGVMVAAGGFRAALLLDAATFVVLALASFAVRTRRGSARTQPEGTGEPGVTAQTGGLGVLRADAVLWPLFTGLMAFVLVGEVTNVVEVFLVRDTLGAGATAFGLVGACVAAGIVAGSMMPGRLVGDAAMVRTAIAGAAGIAICCIAAGLAPSVAVLAVAWAVLGVANGALNVAAGTLVMTRTPEAVRGQVLAVLSGASRGFSVGALVLGGLLGSLASPRLVFVGAGVGALCVAAILARRLLGRTSAGGGGAVAAGVGGRAEGAVGVVDGGGHSPEVHRQGVVGVPGQFHLRGEQA